MPQIILNDKGTKPTNNKPDKPDDPDSKKKLLIGAGAVGVLVLAIALILMMRPATVPREDKVPPPPGMPDVYPYNSREYQKQGRPTIGGMPPPSVLNQFKNQSPPKQ